jgi:hypothetical protein
MAVDANKTALLVDIGRQIMPLNSIRPGDNIVGRARGVRRAIFPVVVVLVSPMEITAHIVAIVTAQALSLRWCHESVAVQRTLFEGKVAGGTAGAAVDIGVVITLGVDMTAQASATEQIVGKRKCGVDGVGVRYIGG